jgi:hypothetical protein
MQFSFSSNGQISTKRFATDTEALQAMTEYLETCRAVAVYPLVQIVIID